MKANDAYLRALGKKLERKRAGKAAAQRLAALERTRLAVAAAGCNSIPTDLPRLARHLGVSVRRLPLPMRGRITIENGEVVAEINDRTSEFTARFTLAHELAHVILEKERIADLRINNDVTPRQIAYDLIEKLCNIAAGEILLPDDWLLDRAQCQHPGLELVCALAREVECSVVFVAGRLSELWNVRFLIWKRSNDKMEVRETIPRETREQIDLYRPISLAESVVGRSLVIKDVVRGRVLIETDLGAHSYQIECVALDRESVLSMVSLGRSAI